MKKKDQEKIEKKMERKQAKGKTVEVNYRMVIHDIVVQKDGYVVIGECAIIQLITKLLKQSLHIMLMEPLAPEQYIVMYLMASSIPMLW
jgi:predicted DCC family thiol-disulfide oxidoreductase YuxK